MGQMILVCAVNFAVAPTTLMMTGNENSTTLHQKADVPTREEVELCEQIWAKRTLVAFCNEFINNLSANLFAFKVELANIMAIFFTAS